MSTAAGSLGVLWLNFGEETLAVSLILKTRRSRGKETEGWCCRSVRDEFLIKI